MDADDRSVAGRFAAQVDYLNRNEDVAVIGAAGEVIDEHGSRIGTQTVPSERFEDLERGLAHGSVLVHGSVMMRRDALLSVGNYDPRYLCCEDYELWTRMIMRGLKLRCMDAVLYAYRRWPGQMSADPKLLHWYNRRAQLKYLRWLVRRRRDLWKECAAILHTMFQQAWNDADWRPARTIARLLSKIDPGGAPYLKNYLMTFPLIRGVHGLVKEPQR